MRHLPITLLFLLSFLIVRAQPSAATFDQARALMQRFIHHSQIPGAAVTVAVDGEIVWSEGFGYADLEQRVPVDPARTRFRTGSVSKPITAAALGVLYEEGKIDLDASIQTYVPHFPQKRWPVTLRQLAGHLAGIRHYRDGEWLSSDHYDSVSDGLAIFSADTLLFEPGARYAYSSYAWNLISAAIEGASGKDFLTYMNEAVFSPLRMDHTTADQVDRLIGYRTRFYTRRDGQTVNAPYVDNSYKWAGGGFLSTTEDLAHFGGAHLPGGLLSDETLKTWTASQRTSNGKRTGYGIGWALEECGHGHKAYGHSGGSVGGITQLIVYPEWKVVVAMLSNSDRVYYGDTHHRLAHLFAPEAVEYPELDEDIGDYTGIYVFEDGSKAEIFLQDGRLLGGMEGQLPDLLVPKGRRRFVGLNGGYVITLGEEGRQMGLTLKFRGEEKEMKAKKE